MGIGIDGSIELLWALGQVGLYVASHVVGGCDPGLGVTWVQIMSGCIPSTLLI
jgi:hypothetical protein